MDLRDARVVEAAMVQPFEGYARQAPVTWGALLQRVVACVALLGTMVVSGVVLGSPRPSALRG